MSMLSAGTMNGTSINNPKGESLGDIKDVMIDLSSGRVAYAVVEFGGLFGIGSKLFAVPLQVLRHDAANKCFVLNADFADCSWQEAVHKHDDASPYWM